MQLRKEQLLWLWCCLICPLRLAKATLTLIPLFGIHEIVFIFATDEQTTGVLRFIKVFFTLFLNSFQVGMIRPVRCLLDISGLYDMILFSYVQ